MASSAGGGGAAECFMAIRTGDNGVQGNAARFGALGTRPSPEVNTRVIGETYASCSPPQFLSLLALATGAVAIGAFAIGALAIGRLAIRNARIKTLEIDELTVRKLSVLDQSQAPPLREGEAARTTIPRCSRR